MGGRLYDARIGRVLQADLPFMESPFWSQGLNRYSYVFNNPLNATDPSGFWTEFNDDTSTQEDESEVVFDDDPLFANAPYATNDHGDGAEDDSATEEAETSPSEDANEDDQPSGSDLLGAEGAPSVAPIIQPPFYAPPPPGLPPYYTDVPKGPKPSGPPKSPVQAPAAGPAGAPGVGPLLPWIPLILSIPGDSSPKEPAQPPLVVPTAQHHIFPQQFEEEFNEIGIPIHEYTIDLPVDLHQQIHKDGWNPAWDDFLHEEEFLPSAEEVLQFATILMYEYGIQGYGDLHSYQ
jgi:hypothetical protein